MRRTLAAAILALGFVALASGAGCGSKTATEAEGSASPQERRDRLTQMMRDTVSAAGMAELEQTENRELRACTAPSEPGKRYDAIHLYLPTVGLEQARSLMHDLYDYWQSVAPEWSRENFEVIEDGIDAKDTPAVYLHIDGFTLKASYFSDADISEFVVTGSAPCAEYADDA